MMWRKDCSVKSLQFEILVKTIPFFHGRSLSTEMDYAEGRNYKYSECITHFGKFLEMFVDKFGVTNTKFQKVCKSGSDLE